MKQPHRSRLFSATLSLVALAAWLLASNHCVLAGVMPVAKKAVASSHCHGSSDAPASEEKERDCDGSKCCNLLSAPSLAFAKDIVSYDAALFIAADYRAFEQCVVGGEYQAPIAEIDTGPPRGDSFAESVLQRSILAHAPPSLV
ncbi:MAG: hypothetical protein AVDCRST_MAG42-1321 [uncultured Chthoniobacterales bacterium]|uniref:Secreted protein n=1 Tax=uncultured Chthoniobacterales bacterium TaxID=1836801 RepID=A0A6J4HV48_9BACT|nr:MAG: hypothetical protein AVDCRST_MAG42-1321 [uncultured Chthoniobacterales bacterium]